MYAIRSYYDDADATPCHLSLQDSLEKAVRTVQSDCLTLPSGAGHDAVAIAELCPVGMLFLRCKGGISHHPAESVEVADIEKAAVVLSQCIQSLAS